MPSGYRIASLELYQASWKEWLQAKAVVVTHYTESPEPKGDPNVETTSVTILAFCSDYPERFPANAREEKETGLL